jgi:hypothetical protein
MHVHNCQKKVNFLMFWAVPIGSMGASWKFLFKDYLFPIYDWIDKNSFLRRFSSDYIYLNSNGADFFATSLLLILNSFISLAVIFYWQLKYDSLPMWLIYCYYCSWVGIGGRIMGAAYALAHKEVNKVSGVRSGMRYLSNPMKFF